MDIVFVMLHYIVLEETCRSIHYIKQNIDTDNYKIIVVDNASPNDSYLALQEKYKEDDKLVLIRNEENLGFARGNNVGFYYAKKEFSPQFIVMLNNDVYLLDKQLYHKLSAEFSDTPFAVAGPMIISMGGGINNNPRKHRMYTIEECNFMIKRKNHDIFWTRLHLYSFLQLCRRIKSKGFRMFHIPEKMRLLTEDQKIPKNDLPVFLCKAENVELHGSCLIFSSEYIKKWDGLDPRTFMYCEEAILYAHMMKAGERTVYLPEIVFFHREDASTNASLRRNNNRKLFDFENSRDGFLILKDVLEEKED